MSRAPAGSRAGVIVVAAGSGSRMGRPKQFLPLLGRPVVEWSLDVFRKMPEVKDIVVVLTKDDIEKHGDRLARFEVRTVEGGGTRLASVQNGLKALGSGAELVLVHDGARPLVTPEVARDVLAAAESCGASVAAVPAKDTLKEVGGRDLTVDSTPDRGKFWQAQTPQAYRREVLVRGLGAAAEDEDASDESQLVERAGQRVRIVPSSYENIKLTTPEDFVIAAALLRARLGEGLKETRSGFGYDIHRLVAGRPLFLAGLEVPHAKGLLGHSDGDVVLHACCDAVLGALGEGEIGMAFPPSDPRFQGISSRKIAGFVLEKLKRRGARILNLDATIVAEEPRLKPRYEELTASLAGCFSLERSRVNLKAKSHEGLGELGRGEAIAAHAAASLEVPA